jgi:hypothetical protein
MFGILGIKQISEREVANVAIETQARTAENYAFTKKPFYSPKEVARIVGCSDQHILNAIEDDKLFALKISPRITRVPLNALMRYLGAPEDISRMIKPDHEVKPYDNDLLRAERAAKG